MSRVDHFDVVVLGGGPAGTSSAIALRGAGLSVAILEGTRYECIRFGETLPGAVVRPLARLGVWETFLAANHQPAHTIKSVWSSDEPYENDSISNPYGPGWHVDRRRFDSMLAEIAEAGGSTVHRGTRISSCERKSTGEWQLYARTEDVVTSLSANWVIDATGRSAWLARQLGIRRRVYDRLVAMVAFGKSPDPAESYTVIEACEDGWWYSAALPGCATVTAFFTDSDLVTGDHIQRANCWGERLRNTHLVSTFVTVIDRSEPLRIVAASTAKLDRAAGDHWLAVGDAAQSGDPLSGQGVTVALESGLEAARVILSNRTDDRYALKVFGSELDSRFEKFRSHQENYYSRVARWPDSTFWARRINPAKKNPEKP